MFRASSAPINTYAGTWIVMAGMGVLALAGAAFLGFSFDRASAVNAAMTAAIPVTLHLFYTRIMARISVFFYAFGGLVIVSCVPIGGHYLSDIVAGAAVWGAFVAMTRLRPRMALHGQANTSAARPASLDATPEQLATR